MLHKKPFAVPVLVTISWISILIAAFTTSVQAQSQLPALNVSDNSCMTCHEDLYFLHDTGNWFCIRESPMTCAGCHGGNPNATIQEEAHTNRKAHPIVNDDVSKCQECHPEKCDERVNIFDQTSGISQVRVAVPYTTVLKTEETALIPAEIQQEEELSAWLNAWEILPILLVAGTALTIYAVYRIRHPVTRKP